MKNPSDEYKKQVLGLIQERLKYFSEIPSLTDFFFQDLPVDLKLVDGNKQLKKFSHAELKSLLTRLEKEGYKVVTLRYGRGSAPSNVIAMADLKSMR